MNADTTLLLVDLVSISADQPVTTSRKIAKAFGKRHDNVVRDIQKLKQRDAEWHALNFEEMVYVAEIGSGTVRKSFEYTVTEEGFAILAMGFTGDKAFKWKLAFFKAFRQMAERLHSKGSFAQWQQIICQDKESYSQASTASATMHRRKKMLRSMQAQLIAFEMQLKLPLLDESTSYAPPAGTRAPERLRDREQLDCPEISERQSAASGGSTLFADKGHA